MSRRTLSIALLLSLIFNAFFLIGWLGGTGNAALADPADRLARSLELTPRQQMRFAELRSSVTAETLTLHAHIAELRDALAQTLEADAPDLERVRMLVGEISSEQANTQTIAASHLGSFIDILDKDQRRMLGRRLGGGRHPEHLHANLKAFDANDDGTIDKDERAAAMEQIRAKHEDRRRQREEIARQFDADGDGTLSGDERQALREHLLEQGLMPPHFGDRNGRPGVGRGEGRGEGRGAGRGEGRGQRGPRGGPGRGGPPPPDAPQDPGPGEDAPPVF
jgi:hypothetical protein